LGYYSGNGGNASAHATGTNAGGNAIDSATATAGPSAPPADLAAYGTTGAATASATASGIGTATARAIVTATSGSSAAIAHAQSFGLLKTVHTEASAPADTFGRSDAQSYVVGIPPSVGTASTFEAAAYLGGLPAGTDLLGRFANAPLVGLAFGYDSQAVDVLGVASMRYTGAATGPVHAYSTALKLSVNGSLLADEGLVVGMQAPNGAGLVPGDTLRLRVLRNGLALIDRTFGSTGESEGFLRDTVLLLGPANASLSGGDLDLQLLFDFTGSHLNAARGADFMIGRKSGRLAGTWYNPNGGSWAAPTDWASSQLPSGPGTQALFGNAISQQRTVTLDLNKWVGSLQFDNASSYTIAPGIGGALTLENAGAPAGITVLNGNHLITAPLILTQSFSTTVAAGRVLTLAGGLTGGTGAWTVNGPGKVVLNKPGNAAVSLPALTIAGASDAWTGRLDVTTSAIIVNNPTPAAKAASIAALANAIASGRNGGTWDGPGITSSTVASTPNTGLALADNADLALSSFRGIAGLTSNALIIVQARYGDATLDGKVDAFDLNKLAAHWQQVSNALWSAGDFTGDGKVNAFDLNLLAANWQFGAASFEAASVTAPWGEHQTESVPEPSTLAAAGACLLLLVGRRSLRPADR
jgi:hypothetical protein